MIGGVLSLLAAVLNCTFVLALGLKRIRNVSSVVTSAYTNSFSALTFIFCCLAKGEMNVNINTKAWLGIVFVALVSYCRCHYRTFSRR